MKLHVKRKKNILAGKWELIKVYYDFTGNGWYPFYPFIRKIKIIWEFTPELASSRDAYHGVLIEIIEGERDYLKRYTYYPKKQELHIDISDREEELLYEGGYVNENYRVQPINRYRLRLFDLKDVKREPQDYRFRRELKRIAHVPRYFSLCIRV